MNLKFYFLYNKCPNHMYKVILEGTVTVFFSFLNTECSSVVKYQSTFR